MNNAKRLITLTIIIVSSCIILTGCNNNVNKPGSNITNQSTSEDSTGNSVTTENTGSNANDNEQTGIDNKTTSGLKLELSGGNYLLYEDSSKENKLLYINPFKKINESISSEQTSLPVISPNKEKAAYLSPFEWETISSIKIVDAAGKVSNAVTREIIAENKNIRDQFTPKKLLWLDDRYLLSIVQFGYGTVTKGGDLFVYDTVQKTFRPLTKLYIRTQFTDMEIKDEYLYVDAIEFSDNSMTSFETFKEVIKLTDIKEAVRLGNLADRFYIAQDLEGMSQIQKQLDECIFDISKPFKNKIADLNGDGIDDTVKYQITGEYSDNYILNVAGSEIKGMGDNLDPEIYIVDIDTNDKYKEIAVQEFGPSSDEKTAFYYYDGTRLIYMGKLQSLCAENGRMMGNGIVKAGERATMLQTWYYGKEYKLDENHLLECIIKELYITGYQMDPLTLKVDLKLYEKPKSKAFVQMKVGEKLNMIGCDGYEWCYAESSSGVKGWFAVDGMTIRENGMESSEVFDGLCFAD